MGEFQSQTGSQALSDPLRWQVGHQHREVSIPNGKPGPLRLTSWKMFSSIVIWFQSQTGSQALSDNIKDCLSPRRILVSIPNGKPGPLRLGPLKRPAERQKWFQSQTGSQALSDLAQSGRRQASQGMFQSQTGSQALSDDERADPQKGIWFYGFNPKREARPSQTGGLWQYWQPLRQCFNPKREARPSQTN